MTDQYNSAADSAGTFSGPEDIYIGEWLVSVSACTLSRGDEEVKITPRSMDVLRLLSERAGSVVSPAELLEAIWRSPIATDHAVHKAIAELRGALHDKAQQPDYIKTIPKRGYKLIAPVKAVGATGPTDGNDPASGTAAPAGTPRVSTAARWVKGLAAGFIVAGLVSLPLLLNWDRSPASVNSASGSDSISLAVMPFSIQDYNDENQIIAEGIRDSLVHGLSKLAHLRVMSPPRNSGYRESNDERYEHYLASADHRLQGSVFSGDGRLRVIVQLVRQEDGVQQYSEQFDLPLTDIFSVQDEIASNVATALRIHLDEEERSQMLDWGTTNALAYQRFLRAEFHYNQFSPEDFHRAMEQYEEAIELDPDFLSAYHGLATAANNLAVYSSMATIRELYEKVLEVHREVGRLDPDSEILDSLHAIKLRMQGNSHLQQEAQLRRQILSGSPPDFAVAHYALLLIGARLYDEASQLLELVADSSPNEISPDEVWSYRYSVAPPPELIMARKNQLQQRPYHIGFLGTVATNLAFLGDFRQARIYLEQQRSVDTEGLIVHNTENIIRFLAGDMAAGSEAFEDSLREDPDFYYNNGALSFMVGDIDRGIAYWRQLQPPQMRRLFNRAHVSERYFPGRVLESPRYQALLDGLGNGKSWQHTLIEGVMEIAEATGIELSPEARQAYENNEMLMRNNLWSEEQWQEFELHKRQRIGNTLLREGISTL